MDESTLIQTTQTLLDAIANADYETYQELVDPSLTCFEPEAAGHLVQGMEFHKYYFDLFGSKKEETTTPSWTNTTMVNTTMVQPHVRVLNDTAAVVSYTRLIQTANDAGVPTTTASQETRVWQLLEDGSLKNVHFHRSVA